MSVPASVLLKSHYAEPLKWWDQTSAVATVTVCRVTPASYTADLNLWEDKELEKQAQEKTRRSKSRVSVRMLPHEIN